MFIYYLQKKKKALRGHLFPRKYKSEFTISPLNFLIPYAKFMCICIISIFLKILKWSRILQGLPGHKSPSVSSISCLWKKKGLSPRHPQVPKSRLKQLMIRTQQSQDS